MPILELAPTPARSARTPRKNRPSCEFCGTSQNLDNWRDDDEMIHLVCSSERCEKEAKQAGYHYD